MNFQPFIIHQLEVGTHKPHPLETGPHEPTPTKVLNVMCLLGFVGAGMGYTPPHTVPAPTNQIYFNQAYSSGFI